MNAVDKANLPEIDPQSAAHSAKVAQYIQQLIQQAPQQQISFQEFMQQALYAPGLGYYSSGNTKFGPAGDFTTAPELTSLFGATLAQAYMHMLSADNLNPQILEFGPGTAKLAHDILTFLADHDCLPKKYLLLETSADLKQRQQQTLAEFSDRLELVWLDSLPQNFSGLVIANEVLDAMPCAKLKWSGTHWQQAFVKLTADNSFTIEWHQVDADLKQQLATHNIATEMLSDNYETEVNLCAQSWLQQLAVCSGNAVVLLIDYGFSNAEYYHPDRSTGTLMCHFRHHSHPDALINCGIQDITAHVDFTHIATCAHDAGFTINAYTNQAQFLIDNGIISLGESIASSPQDLQALQYLLMPHEMGELFKVMILSKDQSCSLICSQDLAAKL